MFELTKDSFEIANCVIINLTKLELGVVRGAEYVTEQQLLAATYYDMIIVVTDNDTVLPDLASHTGIKLLICPTALAPALFNQQQNLYDGVIQCEAALTTALLQDLIEPITTESLLSFDCEDLRSFFAVNKAIVNYQRLSIANDTCPPFIIPTASNKPNTKLGALLILTNNLNTKVELIADISNKVTNSGIFTIQGLATREAGTNGESEALGVLSITQP